MSATIAISNQKGGVAKTTTCLSLGAALAEMGHTVLLLDLDPQANLTLSLGLKPESLRRTVVDSLLGTSSLVSISRETGIADLDIAPANHDLALVDKVFYKMPGYQFRLREAIARTHQDMYDYILLDCPPSLAPLTLNALVAANLLVIPVQCEIYAAYSLRLMVRLALQIREQCNPGLDYRGLVTMYDQRNKISQMILEQLQAGGTTAGSKKHPFFKTVIQVDSKLKSSPAFSQPITTYASRSRGAEQYRALAQELDGPEFDALLRKRTS
jgi:chromosome partitioning protein